MNRMSAGALVGVDIPIGVPASGSRQCDLEARRRLGQPRGSSVFPAPVRGCLREGTHPQLSALHRTIDGRGLTVQAYHILPKIRQVERYIAADPKRHRSIFEIHPEASFALWNGGKPMQHNKTKSAGRAERERLIDAEWPGQRERLWASVRGRGCGRDDLKDAFAALWTIGRIAVQQAVRMPVVREHDGRGMMLQAGQCVAGAATLLFIFYAGRWIVTGRVRPLWPLQPKSSGGENCVPIP